MSPLEHTERVDRSAAFRNNLNESLSQLYRAEPQTIVRNNVILSAGRQTGRRLSDQVSCSQTKSLLSKSFVPQVMSVSKPSVAVMQQQRVDGCLELDERTCRSCYVTGMMIEDWKNGDRVCTNCGIVDEEHLTDTSPEWREYENDDRGTAPGAGARSGLVVNDETKYWGGLQPTSLSKYIFNGPSSSSASSSGNALRKSIAMADYRVSYRIEQMQKKQLADAKLSYQVRKKQKQRIEKQRNVNDDFLPRDLDEDNLTVVEEDARPEYENLILQEEEEANRIQMALYADKWSLDRALKLYGNGGIDDTQNPIRDDDKNDQNETGALHKKLDKSLRKASLELYTAHNILCTAAAKLKLPPSITNEAVSLLCRYAQLRDGFAVRGVVSNVMSTSREIHDKKRSRPNRMTYSLAKGTNNNRAQLLQQQINVQRNKQLKRKSMDQDELHGDSIDKTISDSDRKSVQREYNQYKQMTALGAGILFLTARKMKSPRSLLEVCESFDAPNVTLTNALQDENGSFIQRKHCSRAMNEIKECFPEFVQSTAIASMNHVETPLSITKQTSLTLSPSNLTPDEVISNSQNAEGSNPNETKHSVTTVDNVTSITNYIEHFLRKLVLPPVAQASVQCLVYFCRNRPTGSSIDHQDHFSTTKLPTLCGALAYFICIVGSNMQTLATQAIAAAAVEPQKRSGEATAGKLTGLVPSWKNKFGISKQQTNQEKDEMPATVVSKSPFDIFNDIDKTKVDAEHRAYEMRRMWDAWIDQMPWKRSISELEKFCGVPQKVIRDYYKQYLFPVREQLLSILRESTTTRSGLAAIGSISTTDTALYPEQLVLGETSLASLLLSHITVAAPLMKKDFKM